MFRRNRLAMQNDVLSAFTIEVLEKANQLVANNILRMPHRSMRNWRANWMFLIRGAPPTFMRVRLMLRRCCNEQLALHKPALR